ncbi:dipeptide epimerase [Dactylosporangium sp. AC04546]|uniref:mandelate racemase/muconate lactonizing enzyme family protein n=1 Tax=Dactylosporangium sp. AC04546 TaxID=2862460 RepID=UPI001EDCC2E2|nr:dipeptide epimerase [Dactylosporangium sp. AC04546]WVK80856.1 dipeptide epimerase [Dactylosporangium sp. AC04546]
MTITDVRTHSVSAPFHTPFVTALRSATAAESLLVEVVDANGRSGFGESPQVWKVTGDSVAGARACVEQVLGPLLIGRDADDLAANCRTVHGAVVGNAGARAAVDTALHDLAARRLGVPLVRLLGGTRLRVPTDVTLSAGDSAAAARVAEGFTVLKVKVGKSSPADEVHHIRRIREAAGPGARIRLDANQGWTPREAVRAIGSMQDAGLDIELVEQPVPAPDLDGLAWVTSRVDVPILADESVFGVRDLVCVIHRRAADMVNVKLAKCGGLSIARTMLDLAAAHDIGTMVGSMMETQVGVGAAASLVAAYDTTVVSDLDAAWWLASTPLTGGLRYDGAEVVLPDAPGLGVHL